jgi:Mycothiol maleylpyruvate isomerase N-terminal domain
MPKRDPAVHVILRTAYDEVVDALDGVGDDAVDDAEWLPTGCAGWTVRDLLCHMLGDAQRALVAFGTPADAPPDTDAISYWRHWRPGTDAARVGLRMTRIAASVHSAPILDSYAETARAVAYVAARTDPDLPVRTQGHVMRAADVAHTLVVEAAVHHLDLVVALDRPGPSAGALALVREALDGLLGEALPLAWDDVTYARAGTGRVPLTAADRAALGPLAERFPLFG